MVINQLRWQNTQIFIIIIINCNSYLFDYDNFLLNSIWMLKTASSKLNV